MDFSDIKGEIPFKSPVQPQQLDLGSEIRFHCHTGIACFNACCRNIDITLTPYDIVRLKNRLNLDSKEFVGCYTVPYEMDHHGMPGLKMLTKRGTSECVFLSGKGCIVYEDRPAACRYYALGSMGVRKKDSSTVNELYFLVKEPHCLGHNEPRTLTVRQYREEQGIEKYDDMNREWREIVLKKRSSGPTLGKPSERSLQLFDMCSYDMDSFREFVQSPGFQEIFALEQTELQRLIADEEALLRFAGKFLKQVLFGEESIPLREGVREKRLRQRRAVYVQRRRDEAAKHKTEGIP